MLCGLFEKIISMSLIGCYVIAVVLVIRLLLSRCGRKFSYVLWFVVFVNLCLPISVEGHFSLIPQRLVETRVALVQGENTQLSTSGVPAGDGQTVAVDLEGVTQEGQTVATDWEVATREDQTAAIDRSEALGEPAGNLSMGEANGALYDEVKAPETLKEAQAGIIAGTGQQTATTVDERVENLDSASQEALTAGTVVSTGENHPWLVVASLVWLAGLAVLWGISLCKGIALSRRLERNKGNYKNLAEGVILAEDIAAPFLWGLWKPAIYLPSNVEEEERVYIVAHESYHRKRLDHILKPLVFGIVAIHWFNPLVWLAYGLFVRDMEISCDEAVLAENTDNIKKQYATSLLKYAAKQNGFVPAPLTFGEPSVKSRVKNVLGYKKRGMVVTVAAVCVVALTACGLILRPQEQGGGEMAQGNETPGSGEAVQGSETPGDTQQGSEVSSYSVYFQDILQAKYEEKDGKYMTIEGEESAREYSYLRTAEDYNPENFAYARNVDFYLTDGGIAEIQWLKLSEDLTLTDLSFDMSEEMMESGSSHNSLSAIFYDEEREQVYVVISAMQDALTWLICFSPENPTAYDIYEYEYISWFRESCYMDGCVFLHNSSGDAPFAIDVETKEGRLCTAEYTAARVATYEWSEEYAKEHGEPLWVEWMYASAHWEDVDIFSCLLMESMDIFPGIADVYVASRDGEILEVMIVETQTGEVTIVDNMNEMTSVRPLLQEEIDWFNEKFFNQGYLSEEPTEASVLEGIRNQFLTHEYAKPEDINISEVFYNGAGEEMTENDWLYLSGEERWKYPLYTGNMVLLTEEEHKEVAQIDVDVSRVSWDTMDNIMEAYTGMSVWETNRYGMESLYFNKYDGVFYKFHGDTNTVFVQVISGHYNVDGTISLYYVRNGSPKWIDESTEVYAVVLRPLREGYQFVSNQRVDATSDITATP